MSRRRHEVGGGGRKPARPGGGGRPRPGRGPRRRGFIARAGERGVALTVLAVAGVAIAGVAVAGAISSGGDSSVQPQAAATSAPPTSSPTTSPKGPIAPTAEPTHSSSPRPTASPTPKPTPTVKPKPTPSPTAVVTPMASPTPKATGSACGSPDQRVAAARRLLQHRGSLPQASVIGAGPRQGLLGEANASARTITLYVRSCPEEPTLQLAVVWGYEAGQFIKTEAWDSATQSKWNQLRGSSFTSNAQFKQDAASVYAFWQTGSTRYWQSPVAPPSFSKLSQLVPYLKVS